MARARRHAALSNAAVAGGLVASLVCAGAVALQRTGHSSSLIESVERRTLDLRFRLRGTIAPGPEVVLVQFDDRTLAEAPQLFERRAGWTAVVAALHAAGAKAIGIDALFSDPERVLPDALAHDVTNAVARPADGSEDDSLLRRIAAELHGDDALAGAIAASKNVVLGVHAGIGAATLPTPNLGRAKYGQSIPGAYRPRVASDIRTSIPLVARSAHALGFVTVYEDDTQSLRELVMARTYGDGIIAPLAVQLVALARGLGRADLAYLGDEHAIVIGPQRVPLSGDDGVLLDFRGPAGTFPSVSAIDVARGRVDPARLRDKIAIVGITQLGRDATRTSFGPGVPGIEIHATAVDNLLHDAILSRASWRTDVLATLAIGLLVTLLFVSRFALSVAAQLGGTLALSIAYVLATNALFVHERVWIAWVGPLATLVLVAGTCLSIAYAREGFERRRVRNAFAHYLSDDLIAELLDDPRALALGGGRRELSVLFSDIRDFTTIAERLEPEMLVRVLNTYLTPMTRAVLREGGYLDKFIGDAVMAVFGAPLPYGDHVDRSLRTALRMHAEVAGLLPAMKDLGVEIDIGIGINTGDMVVGNMGAEERFSYTVMGDAVNLASRLEGLTKVYGVFCLVGEATRRAAGPTFSFRELDRVQVKGKANETHVYELLGSPTRTIAGYVGLERFDEAVACWRAGRLDEARALFEAFAIDNPRDRATRVYLERIAAMGDTLPAGWRGVVVYRDK